MDRRRLLLSLAASSVASAAAARAASGAGKWGAAAGPWSTCPTTDVVEEGRRFRSGDAMLAGTLYRPRSPHRTPAIVVFHGASSPLRNSPLYDHLRQILPPLGIAVFIFDRRGSGESTGDLQKSDYAMLADDGIAAARMLSGDSRVDPGRIGVWGLSQGGWLSLLAASRDPRLAFAISISAPVVTPDVQMLFSSTNSLRVNGYSEDDIREMTATRRAVDDYMRGTGTRAEAEQRLADAKSKPWFKYLYMGDTIADRSVSRWRREIEHDPLKTLQSVRCPALILFGANDPVVPVAASVARIREFEKTHRNIDLAVVAGADHGMQTTVSAKQLLDPAQADAERPNAPEYFGLMASWLTRDGFASPDFRAPTRCAGENG